MSYRYPRPPKGQHGYDPTIRPPRGQHGSGPGPTYRNTIGRHSGTMGSNPAAGAFPPSMGSAAPIAAPPHAQAQVAFDPSQLANYQPGGGRTGLGDAIRAGGGSNNLALISAIQQMDPNALALLIAARKRPVSKRGVGNDRSGVFTPKV